MSYFYKSVEDCIASKQHLTSCDADGYCNNCGEQSRVAKEVLANEGGIVESRQSPLPDPKTFIEPLVTPVFEGTFAEPDPIKSAFIPMLDQSYNEFIKFDIRTGTITTAGKIKKKDRLLLLEVYLGEDIGTRTIVAGIAEHFAPEFLVGLQVMVVTNLEPRKLGGHMSHGMILAGKGPTGLSLAGCMGVPDGTKIG